MNSTSSEPWPRGSSTRPSRIEVRNFLFIRIASSKHSFQRALTTVAKTKDDYVRQLLPFYLGDEVSALNLSGVSENSANEFWEWTFCFVFKNPDAQKAPKWVRKEKAFQVITSMFNQTEMDNEVQKLKFQEAHEEVVRLVIEDMANEDGKVPMFKGGRFELIESKKEADRRNKANK